jgi:hypothetical protein
MKWNFTKLRVANLGMMSGVIEILPVVRHWMSLSLPAIQCTLTEYVVNSIVIRRSCVFGEKGIGSDCCLVGTGELQIIRCGHTSVII